MLLWWVRLELMLHWDANRRAHARNFLFWMQICWISTSTRLRQVWPQMAPTLGPEYSPLTSDSLSKLTHAHFQTICLGGRRILFLRCSLCIHNKSYQVHQIFHPELFLRRICKTQDYQHFFVYGAGDMLEPFFVSVVLWFKYWLW